MDHNIMLESPRLVMREWTPDDAHFLYELNLDPEVIRYTGDAPFGSETESRNFIMAYDHYRRWGYGRWLCVEKNTGQAVGWCGLKNQVEELGIVDLGYRFSRNHWGKGFATEAAREVIRFGFEKLGIPVITARVAIGNDASVAVIMKCGMKKIKEDLCEHHPANWYALEKTAWERIPNARTI